VCSYCFLFLTEHTQEVFPRQGTTSFLATVVFPLKYPEKTAAVLSCLGARVGLVSEGRAILEGIHAEVRAKGKIF